MAGMPRRDRTDRGGASGGRSVARELDRGRGVGPGTAWGADHRASRHAVPVHVVARGRLQGAAVAPTGARAAAS
eukprot:2683882-Pyramimonas_sp.AAC.1